MKGLSLYLKVLRLRLSRKKSQILQLQREIDDLVVTINKISAKYENVFRENCGDVAMEFWKNTYLHSLIDDGKKRIEQLESLEKLLARERESILRINAELKAVEKYIDKLEKFNIKRRIVTEGREVEDTFGRSADSDDSA